MPCACILLATLPLFADSLSNAPPKAPPPTPREIAWRVLSGVHLAVGKAQASVQPYVMLHLAENTVGFNRKMALTEFRDAFTDARIMETTYRAPLQAQIVSSVAPIDIPTAIDLVRTVRPNPAQRFARDNWDRSVLAINSQLMVHSRPDEAVELIKLVSTPGVFPNQAASNLINTLPPADDRRLGVFGYAATCYRQVPFPGFTALVQDHWQAMPRVLVVMAANAVADDGSHATRAELTQILPILREVDPPRAERLLSEHPEIVDPDKQKPRKKSYEEQNDERQLQQIPEIALKSPMPALQAAQYIHDPDVREQAILQIAAEVLQNGGNPDVANRALQMLLQLPAKSQRDLPGQLAELAAYAGKTEQAGEFVDASFDLAGKLLEVDLDAKSECGVNPGPRDWWPSTAAYRTAMHAAVTVFHEGAEKYLARMQHDADLYLLQSIEFARALIGGATTSTPRLSCADAAAIAAEAELR
jgi:hypothetical protein